VVQNGRNKSILEIHKHAQFVISGLSYTKFGLRIDFNHMRVVQAGTTLLLKFTRLQPPPVKVPTENSMDDRKNQFKTECKGKAYKTACQNVLLNTLHASSQSKLSKLQDLVAYD